MSVDISIKQGGLFKKNIDLKFLKGICSEFGFSFGISNSAYVLDLYEGGDDIEGIYLVIYNERKIGRGFSFCVDANKRDCSVRLNNPCTDNDINDFYGFVQNVCDKLKAKTFEQDGAEIKVADIIEIKKRFIKWNVEVLQEQLEKYQDYCVFGAVYPIFIEAEFVESVKGKVSRPLMDAFTNYLHSKQNVDCYYAKAIMYKNQEDEVMGVYAITEGVRSIFPVEPYIPIGLGIDIDTEVKEWSVNFCLFNDGEPDTSGKMSFDDFATLLNLRSSETYFDAKHVIIELGRKDIEDLFVRLSEGKSSAEDRD